MADEYTGPDVLIPVLTGASAKGVTQRDHFLSLGGFCSNERIDCMTPIRLGPLNNIHIVHVGALNGIGNGALIANAADQLKWQPPSGTVGSAVDVLNGETKVLQGGGSDTDKIVVVKRTSALSLGAYETIQIRDTVNNAIGGSNFTAAQSTSGHEKYRAIQFWNKGSANVTDVLVWVNPAFDQDVRIAAETPTAGEIQTIADEDTAPTGRSWSAPTTEGTALNLGTVAADATIGLWIERSVDVGESAIPLATTVLHYRFTYGGSNYYGVLRGCSRVAEAGIAGWYLYWGEDAEPNTDGAEDEFVADADRVSASPFAATKNIGATPSTTHFLQIRYGNQHGILSPPREASIKFRLDGASEETGTPPSAPAIVQVSAYTSGEVRIEAEYFPSFDALADRPTHWAVWWTSDGTDPDPVNDPADYTEAIQASSALDPRKFDYTTNEDFIEGAPVRVVVRTRRSGTPNVDSENTAIYEAIVSYCGPDRPIGFALFGRALGIQQAETTIAETTVWIDQGNNIYWKVLPGETQLWADTALVWNLRYDSVNELWNGFYTTFTFEATDIDTTGTADAVEVITWGVTHTLGINVQGQRRMLIDIDNAVIYYNYFDMSTEPSGSCQALPAVVRYQATAFQVWDKTTARYKTAAGLHSDGGVRSRVPWLQFATQAECL